MKRTLPIAVGALAIILVGCAGSPTTPSASMVADSRPISTATAVPAASPTLAPTPDPTPSPSVDPSEGLSFGELDHTTNTCYTTVTDAEGHVLHGGILTFKMTVKNAADHPSVPIWLRIDPGFLLSPPLAMEGSTGKAMTLDPQALFAAQSLVLGGLRVPAHGQTKMHWQVFLDAAGPVHYDASMREGDPTSTSGVGGSMYTTINVC